MNKNSSAKSVHKRKKSHKALIITGIIVLILVVFYLLLPTLVLNYSNKKLTSMREYYGHIEDIDIHLIKGTYSINNMYLDMIDTVNNDTIPFLKVKEVDLAVNWKMLFKKKILADVFIDSPELTFINKKAVKEKAKKTTDTLSVKQLLSGVVPFRIDRFEIQNGKVKYKDENVEPTLNLEMNDLYLLAENITNLKNSKDLLPSDFKVNATIYEGKWDVTGAFNLMKNYPTFDLKLDLKNLNLVQLNDFLREYAKLDLKTGKFSMFSEFAAKNGSYEGYVKPFVKDFEVNKPKKDESTLKKVWRKVVDVGMDVLENKKSDKVATKVSIEGTFENSNVSIWEAISKVLTNAFIKALKPSFDNDVNIGKVDSKDKDNKDKDKKEDKDKDKDKK